MNYSQINEVKINTGNGSMHNNALKAVIVNVNSELRNVDVIPAEGNAAASIDPAALRTEDLNSIGLSENNCTDKCDIAPVHPCTAQ